MGDPATPSEVFNDLAFEFADRLRRGEHPSLTEYIERHPELADDIRDLFPTLVMIERAGSGAGLGTAKAEPASTPSVFERLGDFHILREIGRRGMGVVYEAEQESLGRRVALKVLTQNRHMGAVQLVRFQREARAAARLHHTNIVPVFGVGVFEGVHYYAMQYIEGRSLEAVLLELVRRRDREAGETTVTLSDRRDLPVSLAEGLLTDRFGTPLVAAAVGEPPPGPDAPAASSPGAVASRPHHPAGGSSSSLSTHIGREGRYYRTAARLVMQVADALEHAHAHGVLHRDVKPANLLLDLEGTLRLTDFGLAKAEGSEELTSPGDVVGTVRYMAPERFRGKSDARSDIYSLGLTLYEMLTLRPAFTASDRLLVMTAILETDPPAPRKLDPRIPRDLETIVLKAIAKRPANRFASGGEMSRELGRFLSGRPIHSRRVSMPERLWRWARKNPVVAALTLLAALLISVLAAGSTIAAWTFLAQRDLVRREQQNTRIELARSLLLQSRALRHSRQPGKLNEEVETLARAARIAEDKATPPALIKELRDEVIASLAEGGVHPVESWNGIDMVEERDAFAFDVDRYVSLGDDRAFHVRRLSDRAELRVVRHGRATSYSWPLLEAGGRFMLVFAFPQQIELWDLDRGEPPAAWPADARCAAFRSDGRQVAALRPDGEVLIFDLPGMSVAARCRIPSEFPGRLIFMSMALSADGRRVAVERQDVNRAWVLDVPSGKILIEPKLPALRVHSTLTLSPRGRLLAVSSDRSIWVYDAATGERLSMLQGHQSGGINMLFLGSTDLLASKSWDNTIRVWDLFRGRQLVELPGVFLGWTRSDSDVVAGPWQDLTRYRFGAAEGFKYVDCMSITDVPAESHFGPSRVCFSPDSRLIALPIRPDGVLIARTRDGAEVARLPIGDCDEARFMPDGSLLTSNALGLCLWPFVAEERGGLRIGPPRPLAPNLGLAETYVSGLDRDAAGRLVAMSANESQGVVVLDRLRPWRSIWLGPHPLVGILSVSPDGRWVASAGSGKPASRVGVRVWNVSDAMLAKEIAVRDSWATFSPDNRLLAVVGPDHFRFLRTSDWSSAVEIPHGGGSGFKHVTFHPSGRIAALMESGRPMVRLADVDTGEILASLENPEGAGPYCTGFSPDGRLFAVAHSDQKVALWDLSKIRKRLVELKLDRGVPDLFESRTSDDVGPPIGPVTVEGADTAGLRRLSSSQARLEAYYVVRGMFESKPPEPDQLYKRAHLWGKLGLWTLAADNYRALLRQRPNWVLPVNALAWCLAARPGRGDPAEAVRWARHAVALRPGYLTYQNTLALALHRAGSHEEAARLLESNIEGNGERLVYDWLVLALCRNRLGQTAAAKAALKMAEASSATDRVTDAEAEADLDHLFQEARNLIRPQLPDLPPDPFAR